MNKEEEEYSDDYQPEICGYYCLGCGFESDSDQDECPVCFSYAWQEIDF